MAPQLHMSIRTPGTLLLAHHHVMVSLSCPIIIRGVSPVAVPSTVSDERYAASHRSTAPIKILKKRLVITNICDSQPGTHLVFMMVPERKFDLVWFHEYDCLQQLLGNIVDDIIVFRGSKWSLSMAFKEWSIDIDRSFEGNIKKVCGWNDSCNEISMAGIEGFVHLHSWIHEVLCYLEMDRTNCFYENSDAITVSSCLIPERNTIESSK